MATFKRPVNTSSLRNKFGPREVGLTHPDNRAYIKLADNGNIELMADEGLGIIIDTHNRTIALYADSIKMFTRNSDGIRWNRLSMNHRATKYTEPALLHYDAEDAVGLFDGIDDIL